MLHGRPSLRTDQPAWRCAVVSKREPLPTSSTAASRQPKISGKCAKPGQAASPLSPALPTALSCPHCSRTFRASSVSTVQAQPTALSCPPHPPTAPEPSGQAASPLSKFYRQQHCPAPTTQSRTFRARIGLFSHLRTHTARSMGMTTKMVIFSPLKVEHHIKQETQS